MIDEVEVGGYTARVVASVGMKRAVGTYERPSYAWEILRGGVVEDSGDDYMPANGPSAAELLDMWAHGEDSAVPEAVRDEISMANAVYDEDGVIIAEFEVV